MAHTPHPAPAHGHGVPDHASGHPHDEHDHDTTKYWLVFLALCVLTGCSFITMHFFGNTPTIGWTIMMAVSCAKAMLVISFFMHLIWEASWKYVLTIPAATMSLFLIFMLVPDVGLRTWWYTEERAHFAADPAAAERQAAPHEAHPATPHPMEEHPRAGEGGHPKAGDPHK
jgi:cytochrome c oxidase subunit 4